MPSLTSHNPGETEALGESWGRSAKTGLVIALSGDLGAGKTQLVKGLARGLGFNGRVHSPTFTLVNVYTGGRLTLYHLDLYRLETPEQILSAGIEEYLKPDGITVIEWAERWFENFEISNLKSQIPPPSTLDPRPSILRSFSAGGSPLFRAVTIESLTETERRISYEDSGA